MKRDQTSHAGRWRSFRRGLLQRSPLVLLAAVVLCLLGVLGVQYFFFGGGITSVAEGRLLRITHDDYIHMVYKVNQLKQDPPREQAVYVFGGSGAMEAIASGRSFGAQIRDFIGRPVKAVNLANHGQSLAQNLMIVDNLPEGEALLLIGLAPMRFNTAPEEDARLLASRPILLRSPRLDELGPELYGREASWLGGLPGAFDFISGYLQQRLRTGPAPGVALKYDPHYYGRDAVAALPLAKRATLESVWEHNRTRYAANHEYNLTVLRELIVLARERGFAPVLFDQPLNTFAAGDWAGVLPKYRAAVGRLALEYDVPYLRIDESIELGDADFADLYHLMPEARARWQLRMAREVGELLASSASSSGE